MLWRLTKGAPSFSIDHLQEEVYSYGPSVPQASRSRHRWPIAPLRRRYPGGRRARLPHPSRLRARQPRPSSMRSTPIIADRRRVLVCVQSPDRDARASRRSCTPSAATRTGNRQARATPPDRLPMRPVIPCREPLRPPTGRHGGTHDEDTVARHARARRSRTSRTRRITRTPRCLFRGRLRRAAFWSAHQSVTALMVAAP